MRPIPTSIDARGWAAVIGDDRSWHLLLGGGDDGPEVYRRNGESDWRIRIWRDGVCVVYSGPCATKLDAQDLALRELEGAGLRPRYRERPGRRQDPAASCGACPESEAIALDGSASVRRRAVCRAVATSRSSS